jgi:hypothetical protein
MIEICPAGPPKLMNPSFSQNQNASRRLIACGLDSSSSTANTRALLMNVFLLFFERLATDLAPFRATSHISVETLFWTTCSK